MSQNLELTMASQDIIMYVNLTFKILTYLTKCHFHEVSAIGKPKMMTFSITFSQIFLRILLFMPETNEKPRTSLSFTTPNKPIYQFSLGVFRGGKHFIYLKFLTTLQIDFTLIYA